MTNPPMVEQLDQALAEAGRFLRSRQSEDGAWRSDRYGNFKAGDALTPLALFALCECGGDEVVALRRGAACLTALAFRGGLTYPVYAASLAVMALFHPQCPPWPEGRTSWLAILRGRQLTEQLGWQPSDREYGGWGYSQDVPRRPPHGQPPPLVESNLSATAFGLDALRAAGLSTEEPAFARALEFVRRCQNFGDDPAFDDGGFFFMEGDPIRNKAGVAGTDRHGRERYSSYGSMTADGLRSLLLCGLPADDGRVSAAARWLAAHFTLTTNPGRWARDRRDIQASIRFYWLWVLARALALLGVSELPVPDGPVRWAEAIAVELLGRQAGDGSWSNADVDVREDDPVVATSLAAATLAVCRGVLCGTKPCTMDGSNPR